MIFTEWIIASALWCANLHESPNSRKPCQVKIYKCIQKHYIKTRVIHLKSGMIFNECFDKNGSE